MAKTIQFNEFTELEGESDHLW